MKAKKIHCFQEEKLNKKSFIYIKEKLLKLCKEHPLFLPTFVPRHELQLLISSLLPCLVSLYIYIHLINYW